jgi:hypothetical protein
MTIEEQKMNTTKRKTHAVKHTVEYTDIESSESFPHMMFTAKINQPHVLRLPNHVRYSESTNGAHNSLMLNGQKTKLKSAWSL